MKKLLVSKKAITRLQAATIVVILVVAIIAGVYYYYSTLPAHEVKEILIGASISITGKYADSGKWHVEAYKLWEIEVNARGGLLGRPIRFIVYDDKSDPTTAVSNYERLITVDKVDLIIGPYASAIVLAASSVAEKYGYVFPEGGGRSLEIFTRGYKYIFLTMPCLAEDDVRGFMEFLETLPAEKRPKSFAFICEDTLYPVSTSVGGMAYVIGGVKNAAKALEWLGSVEKVTLETVADVAVPMKLCFMKNMQREQLM
jgi:branched-chain amino acid transport system substrate-binding protein